MSGKVDGGLFTVISAAPLPSFPRKRESRTVVERPSVRPSAAPPRIPAYAGRTDSGRPARYADRIPAYAGMTDSGRPTFLPPRIPAYAGMTVL